ncbi:MAG: V-type ATP synthase subunit F [Candidatus Omnitrophota bacterium]
MNFFCIAEKESSLGFKFSGIEVREANSRIQAQEALRVASAIEGIGIIIITEKCASWIREEITPLLYRQELPLVLEIPSRGSRGQRKSVGEFLKEIVGVGM